MPFVKLGESEHEAALRHLKKKSTGATTRIGDCGWLIVEYPNDPNATIVIKNRLAIAAFKAKYPGTVLPKSLYWEALDYSKAKNRQLRDRFKGQI